MLTVESTKKEFVIKLNKDLVSIDEINDLLKKIRLKELILKSQMTENQAKEIDREIKNNILKDMENHF